MGRLIVEVCTAWQPAGPTALAARRGRARRISYPESLVFERVHEDVYHEHGFDLIDIPPGRLADHADAIEAHLIPTAKSRPGR